MPTAIGIYAALPAVKARLGKTDTTEDTLLGSLCDQINAWIESYCGRPMTPYTATYTFDGPWTRDGTAIVVPRGIRTITTLKIAGGTGQTLNTIAVGNYFMLPREQDRTPGWPATRVVLTDTPVGAMAFTDVPVGLGVAEIEGGYGWAVEPDEVVGVAETAVVRAWHARQAGQQDIIGTDETGAPIVSRYVAPRDRDTLDVYRWKPGIW